MKDLLLFAIIIVGLTLTLIVGAALPSSTSETWKIVTGVTDGLGTLTALNLVGVF